MNCRATLEFNNESVANGTGIDMVATYTCNPGYAFTGQYGLVSILNAKFLFVPLVALA
jgi:hypothetical protein